MFIYELFKGENKIEKKYVYYRYGIYVGTKQYIF